MPKEMRVTKAWRATYTPALRVSAGQIVAPGVRDEEFPGWQWAVDASGLGGWLPESILDGSKVTQDFDTKELTVRENEPLTSSKTCLGWHWCENARGESGWIPATHITPRT